MGDANRPSLLAAPRVLWGSFIAVWIFPIFFFFGANFWGWVSLPTWLFWVIAGSLLFVGLGRPAFLMLKGRLSYVSLIVWGMLTPWLIWSLLVFAQFAVQRLAGSSNAP